MIVGSLRNAKSSFSGVAMTIVCDRNASSSPAAIPLAPYSDETVEPSVENVFRNDLSVCADRERRGHDKNPRVACNRHERRNLSDAGFPRARRQSDNKIVRKIYRAMSRFNLGRPQFDLGYLPTVELFDKEPSESLVFTGAIRPLCRQDHVKAACPKVVEQIQRDAADPP
jgi:hypothetical protein